jgi:hypothetical protein
MDGIVLALIALRNEFRPLDLSALARRYRVEEVGQDRLMLTANREVRP